MIFDFLKENLYKHLSFKKNYFFKSKSFLDNLKLDSLNYYLLDRFIQYNEHLQDPSNWDVSVENKTAFFNKGHLKDEISSQYQKFLNLKFNEQINYLMKDEYSYLLPELIDGKWEIIDTTLDSLLFTNNPSNKVISKEIIQYNIDSFSMKNDVIIGLFIPKNEKYRLIDGYHKLLAAKKVLDNSSIVTIIAYFANND